LESAVASAAVNAECPGRPEQLAFPFPKLGPFCAWISAIAHVSASKNVVVEERERIWNKSFLL
jgi:hypothetical protein